VKARTDPPHAETDAQCFSVEKQGQEGRRGKPAQVDQTRRSTPGRIFTNRENRNVKRLLESLRRTSGEAVRVKVVKHAPAWRFAFLPAPHLELSTVVDHVDATEKRRPNRAAKTIHKKESK